MLTLKVQLVLAVVVGLLVVTLRGMMERKRKRNKLVWPWLALVLGYVSSLVPLINGGLSGLALFRAGYADGLTVGVLAIAGYDLGGKVVVRFARKVLERWLSNGYYGGGSYVGLDSEEPELEDGVGIRSIDSGSDTRE